MIASAERRVLFVHVQKTAGSSVDQILLERLPGASRVSGLSGGRHATLRQAIAAHTEMADYWVFGFVRNPWARLYSWHSMVVRRGEAAARGNEGLARRIARSRFWGGVLERYPTFERFVLEAPDEFGRLRRPQLEYLRTGRRRADFIGRTESFDADLATVLHHLRIDGLDSVPRRNVAPAAISYREHYTSAMRKRVAQLFEVDIREFGYEF